jgi:GTPase SAR1 family protein
MPIVDWIVDVSQTHRLIKKSKILIIGLKNAGKSKLIWRIAEDKRLPGSFVSMSRRGSMTVTKGNMIFTTLEVGGPDPDYELRADLVSGAAAVIFVVDATDADVFDEATAELHALAAAPGTPRGAVPGTGE